LLNHAAKFGLDGCPSLSGADRFHHHERESQLSESASVTIIQQSFGLTQKDEQEGGQHGPRSQISRSAVVPAMSN
jgi:hypothetical protein